MRQCCMILVFVGISTVTRDGICDTGSTDNFHAYIT